MGFRNPTRSATAVDTGAGVIPGVKVYSDNGNPGAGVVEWDAYNARALAKLTSTQTGSGGSSWSIALDGGPSVNLGIQPVAAGGYESVLTMTADRFARSSDAVIPFTVASSAYAAGGAGVPKGERREDRIELSGSLTSSGAYAAAAGSAYQVGSIPSAYAPAATRYFVVALATGSVFSWATLYVTAAGAVFYIPAAAVGAGFTLSLAPAWWRLGAT